MLWASVAVVVFGSFLWTISEGSVPIRQCTTEIPSPFSVEINDCEAAPCNLYAGSTANLTIHFSAAKNNTEKIHAEIVAYINDEPVVINIPNELADVCNNLANNAHCPLGAGDNATYFLMVPMDKKAPNLSLDAEVALVDDKGECISCFVADIRVNAQNDSQVKA